MVIHNAAYVGTDVVALNSSESTATNVEGTYNVLESSKILNFENVVPTSSG